MAGPRNAPGLTPGTGPGGTGTGRRRGAVLAALLGTSVLVTPSGAQAQGIVADGSTATGIQTNGTSTDITTGTIHGGLGFNSFARLDVASGHTVSIHAPGGTTGTINLIRDRASLIEGTVQGMLGGVVGGSMVLANPNGIVIGPDGQVRAGSVTLSTPDAGFVAGFFGPDGRPAPGRAEALLDGSAPRADADVVVHGTVSGPDGVTIRAGRDVILGTTSAAGRAAAVSAVAATGGRRAIVLDAGRDVAVHGTLRASTGDAGGGIDIRAGRDATLSGTLDAAGRGDGAGGSIRLLAERAAWLTPTGSVLANAPGAGDGGQINFSGLSTVRLDGRLTAAASQRGATPGSVVIDPEELDIFTDQLWEGQHVTLEASQRITVHSGVTITTRITQDPALAIFPFSLGAGDAGDLTLRAPIIDIGERARLLANGGIGADGTVFSGGTIRLEAHAIRSTPGLFAVESQATILLGAGSMVMADSVTIEAVAESRLHADTLADLIDLGALIPVPELAELAERAVDSVVNTGAALGISALPASLTARATIDSQAGRIDALSGNLTISARATTDVDIAPADARLSVIAVQTHTTADVVLRSSSEFLTNFGLVQRQQNLFASGLITIEAVTHEAQHLAAHAAGPGAFALVLSDRSQRAQVDWRRGFVDTFFGPAISIDGDTLISARATRDLRLSAVAQGDVLAGALVISQQSGLTEARGGSGTWTRGPQGITLEAVTREDRLDVLARAVQGTTAPPALPDASPPGDTTATEAALRRAGGTLQGLANTGQGTGALSATPGAAIAGAVLFHDQTTRAEAPPGGFGGMNAEPAGWSFEGVPPAAGPVSITATTELADVSVIAEAQGTDPLTALLPVVYADLGLSTEAVLGLDVITSGDVTVSARSLMPGAGAAGPAVPVPLPQVAANGAGLDGAGLDGGAALPALSDLLPGQRGVFAARALGPAQGVTLAAPVSVLRLDVQTDALLGNGQPYGPRIEGPYFYDYSSSDWPEAFFIRRLTVQAETAGALLTTAGLAADQGALTAAGAGIAVTDLMQTTRARVGLDVAAREMLVRAAPGLTVATLAAAGQGAASGVTGALALTQATLDTVADVARTARVIVRAAPGYSGGLTIQAQDATNLITLAGITGSGGQISAGVAAAVNLITRNVRAALGSAFDLDYEGIAYYADRPFLFDMLDGNSRDQALDGLTVQAVASGTLLAAAAPGADDGLALSDTDPLRPVPTQAGGVSLAGAQVFADITLGSPDGRDLTHGATSGFALAGAFAATAGTSQVSAYIGTGAVARVAGDVQINARDMADALALTGAAVGGAAHGVAGGAGVVWLDRTAATRIYGSQVLATGAVSIGALTGGRDVAFGGSATGAGLTGGAVAASAAAVLGSRAALVRIGAARIDGAAVQVSATDSGDVAAIAGAAEALDSGTPRFGAGLAAALIAGGRSATVDLSRFDGNPDIGAPAPDAAVTLFGTAVTVSAQTDGRSLALARSVGLAGRFAQAGSGAAVLGTRTATITAAADLVLPGATTLTARAAGEATARAGADAGGALGVGLAFAWQGEDRSAAVTLSGTSIRGFDGENTGLSAIRAEIDGQQAAIATGGAAASGGNPVAVNAAIAIGAAGQSARVTIAGTSAQPLTALLADTAITARIAPTATRLTQAGGSTQAGARLGVGLGLAVDSGTTTAQVILRDAALVATQRLALSASVRGAVSTSATNGDLGGATSVGVNLAAIAGTSAASVDLGAPDPAPGTPEPERRAMLVATRIEVLAEDIARLTATADAVQPDSLTDGETGVVAGVAVVGQSSSARITAQRANMFAGISGLEMSADAQPQISATSQGVDALRLDFSRAGVTNLSAAAALGVAQADAALTLTDSYLEVLGTAAMTATARIDADVPGLLRATATTRLDRTTVLGFGAVDITASATARVHADDTLTSARGAAARAADADTASRIDAAAGTATDEDADALAFAATLTPQAAESDARVLITDSTVIGGGAVAVLARGMTDVTLGAGGTGLSVALALTDTRARTELRDSLLRSDSATLSIESETLERQVLTARAPGNGDPLALAGIVSLRRGTSAVVVANAVDGTGLAGPAVTVAARALRDLTFDARAAAGSGPRAAGAVLSYGDGLVSAGLGGEVVAGAVTLDARASTNLSVTTEGTGGADTAGAAQPDGLAGMDATGEALRRAADLAEARGTPAAEIDGSGGVVGADRLALALALVAQNDRVVAQLGGTVQDGGRGAVVLPAARISALQVGVTARHDHGSLNLRSRSFLGLPDDPATTGRAVSAALTLFGQRSDVRAVLTDAAQVSAPGGVTLTAETRLDPQAGDFGAQGLRDGGTSAEQPGRLVGGNWTIDQGSAAAAQTTRSADVAVVLLDLSTRAEVAGTIASGALTARADTGGGISARAGGLTQPAAMGTAQGQGLGAGIAATLLRETTTVTLHDGARAGAVQTTAGSALRLLMLGHSKGMAAEQSFNGGLGIVAALRLIRATLDPAARVTGTATITATDDAEILAAGAAQSGSGGVSVGLGAALILGETTVEALYGRRENGVLLDITGTSDAPAALTLLAQDRSLNATIATAGSGVDRALPRGGFSILAAWSALVGVTGQQSGLSAALEAGGERGMFGLGISGAFAGHFGSTQVAARAHGVTLRPGSLTATALGQGHVVTLSGAAVSGTLTNAIGGAASLLARDSAVIAQAQGLTTAGAVSLSAQQLRTARAIATGANGATLSALSVAGSIALDRSASSAVAELTGADLGPVDPADYAGPVSVSAETGGSLTLTAGGRALLSAVSAGLAAAQSDGSTTTRATLLNPVQIRASTVTVTAATRRDDRMDATATAVNPLAGVLNLAGAIARDQAQVSATAQMIGGVVVARDRLAVQALGTASDTGGGLTRLSATREDFVTLGAIQAGGARTESSGSRQIIAEAAGGQFAVTAGAGAQPGFEILARDAGDARLSTLTIAGSLASGISVAVNDSLLTRTGAVAARLGAPMPATGAPPLTALGVMDAGAHAAVTALDNRSAAITAPQISGSLASGLSVAAQRADIDDTRAVTATVRDILVLGQGRLEATATRSGDLTITSFGGDVNPFGLASLRGTLSRIESRGEVSARILGTQLAFGAGFGGLSTTALDSGDLRVTNIEIGVAANALGVRVTGLTQRRNVRAEVGDSDTRIMALPVTGAVAASATANGTVSAPSFALGGALVVDAGAVITMITSERDIFAAVGGPVVAGSVSVDALRAETLRLIDAEVSVAGVASISGRVGLIRQGGATEARLVANGVTTVSGDTLVRARDLSSILAVGFAANVAPGGLAGSGDFLFLDIGGGEALRTDEGNEAARAQAAVAAQARAQAADTVDQYLPPVDGTPNPLRPDAPAGSTIARVQGADLDATTAAAFNVTAERQRAEFGGALTVSATTDVALAPIAGNISAATGAGVTAGVVVARRGTETRAEIDTSLTQGVQVTGALSVTALSAGDTTAMAFGVAVAGGPAISASAAVVLDRRASHARVSGIARARGMSITATSNGDAIALALPGTSGGGSAVGVGLALAMDGRETTARADGATLTTTGLTDDLILRARAAGRTMTVGFGASVGGGAGVTVALALAQRRATTDAGAAGAVLTSERGIEIGAFTDAIDGGTRPGAEAATFTVGGGGAVGVAAGFAVADWAGTTTADLSTSTTTAQGLVRVQAQANANLSSIGIGTGVGGEAGIGGSFATSERSDTVSARISGGAVTTNNSVVVTALTATGSDAFAGGTQTADAQTPRSDVGTRLSGLGVTIGVGGVFGGGVTVNQTRIRNTVTAGIDGGAQVLARSQGFSVIVPAFEVSADQPRSTSSRVGVVVVADSLIEQRALAVTAGASAVAAVAFQVATVDIDDTVRAYIGGDGPETRVTTESNGSIGVQAQGSVVISAFNVGIAGAGEAGIGAVASGVYLTRTMDAFIRNAQVTTQRNLRVTAQGAERLRLVDVAGGGALFAGIAGAVTVVTLENDLRARVEDARITTGWDLSVQSTLDRDLETDLVGAGLGIGVGSAGLMNVELRDRVLAELSDDMAGAVVASVRNLDVYARTTQLIDARAASLALGVGALQGTVATLLLDTDVRARIGAGAQVGSLARRASRVEVNAETRLHRSQDEMLSVGQLSISGFAYGAGVAVLSARSVTEAEVGTRAQIRATGGVTVNALTDRTLATGAGAYNINLGGSVQVLAALTLVGDRTGGADDLSFATQPALALSTDTITDGLDGALLPDGYDTDLSRNDAARNAAGARMLARLNNSAVPPDADRTVARVSSQAVIDTNGSIGIIASDLTMATARAGGLGLGGALSAVAGVARVRVNSTVGAETQAGVSLSALNGQIDILAGTGEFDQGRRALTQARAFAGTVGLLFGAANVADATATTSRRVRATLAAGSTATAALGVTINADSQSDVRAETRGFAAGLVAASAMRAQTIDTAETTATMAGTVSGSDLTLRATALGDTSAQTNALNLSLGFSGGAISASATENTATTARLSGTVTGGGSVLVRAEQNRDVDVDVSGITASVLFAVGGSWATADVTRAVLADVTTSATVNANALTVRSIHRGTLSATAANGGGALGVGVMGSIARVTLRGSSLARLQAASLATGSADLEARSIHTLDVAADSTAVGLIGAGGAADATADADMDAAIVVQTSGAANTRLSAVAGVNEGLTPTATGAGGGLAGVIGSDARAISRSDSTVALGGTLSVGALRLITDHQSRFAPVASSVVIAALGLGGARSNADIATASGITLTGGQITARDIAMDANSGLLRIAGDRAAVAGSGGGFGAVGATASQTVSNLNGIAFNPDAALTQTGTGGVRLGVRSDVRLSPSAQITTLEAISVPRAQATATATNRAAVTLGANARLTASGAITIQTQSYGALRATANADTTAAGSRIDAQASATYTADERITLANGARIDGAGTVQLATGGGIDTPSLAEVGATATFRANSIVPLDRAPRASVTLGLTSRIDIAGGAQVNAGGSVTLSTRQIDADALALGRGRNLWTDFANTVLDWIGSSRDLEVDGIETATVTDDSGVVVDGVVASGLSAQRYLRYDQNGNFRAGDAIDAAILNPNALDVPVTATQTDAATLRTQVLADLAAQRAALVAGGRTDLVQLLDLQIAEVTAQLDLLAARAGGGLIEVVRIGDIRTEGADILISGGYLRGNGDLRPTADLSVTLRVERANAVTILGNIRVPDQPGRVLFNSLPVNSALGVAQINRDIGAQMLRDRAFQTGPDPLIIGWDTATPGLRVISAASVQGARVEVTALNDLYAAGNITNRAGLVRLALPPTGSGSLIVQGNITAQSVELVAPNVIVGLTPGLRNVAGDPQAMLFDRLNAPDLLANEVAALGAVYTAFTPADLNQGTPAILAQNVSIYGEYVNINGRIEAGGPAMTTTIGAGTDAWINTVLLPSLSAASPERVLIHNPLTPTQGSGISGNLAVYYNTRTDRIEFDPIVAQGGQVRIAGNLISTGNGEIVVLDGFSNIAITSASTRVHRFDTVDTGGENGVQGRVELIDLRSRTRTVYTGIDTALGAGATRRDILRQVYTLPAPDGGSASALGTLTQTTTINAHPTTGARSATYAIQTINGAVPFIDYVVRATHTGNAQTATNRTVSAGSVQERTLAGSSYYSYSRAPSQAIQPVGIYDHQHSFRANEPVGIRFVGDRTGSISIDAGGSVELTGQVRSEGAGLSVTAGGAILGRGPAAELRAAQISLITRSASAITGAALEPQSSIFRLDGTTVALGNLLAQGLDLSALFGAGTLTVQAAPVLTTRTSAFTGLTQRPEAPDLPLQIHLTQPRNAIAAGITARTGTTAGLTRGNIALEARETGLRLTTIDGRVVTLAAQGGIDRTGGMLGAGPDGLEIRATRGLTLTSTAGGIGTVAPIRFAVGDGRLGATARGDIYLAHDPNAPFAQGTLRVGQIVSNTGSVDLTSRGAILDANDTGFRNRVTEEAALAAFWENAGLLGAERTARITAEEEAQRAARQADFDLYWAVRDRLGGEPSKAATDALFGQIAEAAQAIGLTPEEAAIEAQRLQASYERGRVISRDIDPTATERPDFTVTLTAAERNAIADDLILTAADLDVALRRDYVVGTTATEIEVEAPNIIAAGNVTLRASAVGEDRLVARILTGQSGPVTPIAGVTDFNVDAGVPRDLLVLLATSEPADIQRRGFPSSRTDIYRSDDLDLSVGGVVNILIHQGLHESVDASVYIGSEGSLTINQISARNRARVKVVGDILASGNAPGIAAQAIILEAQRGSVGSSAEQIRVDAGPLGGAVDLDVRAGGTAQVPGEIHLRRVTAGDITLGGIIASGSVDIRATGGNLLARNTATFVEGPSVTLIASGRIGTRVSSVASAPGNLPVNVRTPNALIAQAGTGLFVSSDQTLTARSVGSDSGVVEIRVTQGDLRLDGERNDPANPASIQIAPALYANPAITTGVSTGPNDLIVNVQTGRLLDAGSDTTFVNQGTPFSVPDIRAGRMVLFTGGFGTADNPVETDVGFIGGNATAGLFATNDRRQQASDSRGLLLGTLSAAQGAINLTQRDALSLASGARITAGGGLGLTVSRDDLTLLGDVTLDAPNVALNVAQGTLALPQAADGRGRNLTVLGNLTATLRRLQVDGLNDALTVFAGGRIDVQGDATITATDAITARVITGRNVTVTGRAPDLPSGGFGPAVNVALRSITAEGAAEITATGNLRADRVQATGDASVIAGGGGVYALLTVHDLISGATARINGSALADVSLLIVTARTLTGGVGDLPANLRLRLTQATVVQDFVFGNAFSGPFRLESLAGTLTLRGQVNLGSARIEARGLSIEGRVSGGDLDIVAIDGLDMLQGSELSGGSVSIAVGGPLGGDFARRDADITMRADARITAQGDLTLTATRNAIITGLQSRRTAPGVGIDITAAHIMEAGDSWVDLTTNAGVTARLRADELSVDPLTGLETQIGGADIVVGRGDILLRQVGDITLHAARTGQGRVDVFGFGDITLAQGTDDTLAAPDSVVVTAMGGLFTTTLPNEAVTVSTRRLFLGAIDGSLGTQAAPLSLRAGRRAAESVSLFAGRHIVGTFDLGPAFVPLLAADTGLIETRFTGGSQGGIVTAAGPITADGLGAFPELDGVYDTRPTLAAVLEEARYPLRSTHRRDNGPFDPTGLDAAPGDTLPPRREASDGAVAPGGVILRPRDPTITRPDEVGLKERAAAIAQAARGGLTLPGAPETMPGNPLQPFGTEYNRLRLSGQAAAAEEDARRSNTRVTVADELKR